ncbi:UNVERIFIED_CONTAM: putative carbohydrate esterase, partial [Sesamum angustifolium]
ARDGIRQFNSKENLSIGEIGLVPCAIGGTQISEWRRGGPLYKQLLSRALAALQGGGVIRAILWYQGESDTRSQEDAKLYKKRLAKFFTNIRSDLKLPELPVVQQQKGLFYRWRRLCGGGDSSLQEQLSINIERPQ